MSTQLENARLDSSAALTHLESTLDAVRIEQTSLLAELARIQQDLETSNGQLVVSNDKVRDLETRIGELQDEIPRLQNEMDGVKQDLVKMGEVGVGIQAALDASCLEVYYLLFYSRF